MRISVNQSHPLRYQQLDLRHERCPMALVQAKLAIRARRSGQTLEILLSDSGSRQDVPRWLDKAQIPYRLIDNSTWITLQLADDLILD